LRINSDGFEIEDSRLGRLWKTVEICTRRINRHRKTIGVSGLGQQSLRQRRIVAVVVERRIEAKFTRR
jgi:hypothetical protein